MHLLLLLACKGEWIGHVFGTQLTWPTRSSASAGAAVVALAGTWEGHTSGSALSLQLGRLWAGEGLCVFSGLGVHLANVQNSPVCCGRPQHPERLRSGRSGPWVGRKVCGGAGTAATGRGGVQAAGSEHYAAAGHRQLTAGAVCCGVRALLRSGICRRAQKTKRPRRRHEKNGGILTPSNTLRNL